MRKTRFGWLELIIGIMMICMGIFTLFHPNDMLTGMVLVYAILAIISGSRDIVFYCRTERYTGFRPAISLTAGIVSLMAGIMLLAYPNAGTRIISLIIPIWFIAHSIFQLASLSALQFLTSRFHYYFSMIASILGLICGCMLLFRPVVSIMAVGTIIGLYLIITGINSIVVAFSKTGFWN